VKFQSRQLKSGWEKEETGITIGEICLFLSLYFLLSFLFFLQKN
jgi:hypothetical protein